MHRSPARSRGRTRRALLAAALPAAFAVVALPAAAQAATIEVSDSEHTPPHAFNYRGEPGERNDVRVTELADGRTIVSDTAPIRIVGDRSQAGCFLNINGDAICASSAKPVNFELGDGNDTISYEASESLGGSVRGGAGIDGGDGNDTFFAGIRRNADGVVRYFGGAGTADKVTYAASPAPVEASIDGLTVNDGHAADRHSIDTNVEILEGSTFGDVLTGSDGATRERFIGGAGDDRMSGLGGDDVFHEGSAPSGADTIVGGAGLDLVDYSLRTSRVDVRMDDVVRNDGEAGERDFVDPNTNDAFGGSAGDFLSGGSAANVFLGNGGDDAVIGNGGDDHLIGGPGVDFVSGGANDDRLETADNTPDTIRCEGGDDTLTRDLRDVDATGCETVNSVGTLALAPKALTAQAGEPARLRMSWTHPENWRKLRTLTLRLRAGDRILGRITISPQPKRLTDAGAVELLRPGSRLTTKDKTVTASLALRLDPSLAGRTLQADVEARDVDGRRQLERAAARVRVS